MAMMPTTDGSTAAAAAAAASTAAGPLRKEGDDAQDRHDMADGERGAHHVAFKLHEGGTAMKKKQRHAKHLP